VDKVVSPQKKSTVLAAHDKNEIKVERVILDSVKDHLIPHLSEKKTNKEMFDALVGLFQITNMNRKTVLRNRLRSMHMPRFDNVTIFSMMITYVCDQLAVIGENMEDIDLMNMALNGIPKSWEPFFNGVCAQENLPD